MVVGENAARRGFGAVCAGPAVDSARPPVTAAPGSLSKRSPPKGGGADNGMSATTSRLGHPHGKAEVQAMPPAAEKIRTQDGATYCSACGGLTEPQGMLCEHCGKLFEGERVGVKCPSCGVLMPSTATRCLECGKGLGEEDLPEKADAQREEAEVLYEILRSFHSEDDDSEELRHILEETQDETDSLVHLSEPLRKVARNRGEKLRTVESILQQARARLVQIEDRDDEMSEREKEVLRQQIRELSREREELLEIEWGMGEIERVYRNLMLLQGLELEKKDRWFRERLEGLRRNMPEREGAVGKVEDSSGETGEVVALKGELREKDDRIRGLEEELRELRDALKGVPDDGKSDVARILLVLDDLLEELPEDVIRRFAGSEDFQLYEKLLQKYLEGE